MSLSKHQRELPELCLLAIFSQMSLATRVSAARVCSEWYQRVREANRKDNSITIVTDGVNETIKCVLQYATKPATRQMKKKSFFKLRERHYFTEWNCLRYSTESQLNSATVQQIMSSFPDITELNFVGFFGLEYLIEMLQAEPWKSQLIMLTVNWCEPQTNNTEYQNMLVQTLFTAINNLPALQYLSLQDIPIYELPILAQLKKICIEGGGELSPKCLSTFLHSLREYATGNVDNLQVEFLTYLVKDTLPLIVQELSEPLLGCFTGFSNHCMSYLSSNYPFPTDHLTSFPRLTSLSLEFFNDPEQFPALFRNLAQFPQLAYLELDVHAFSWEANTPEQLPPRPCHQLLSVRTLKLLMYISAHFILRWLNLPVTMPNVQDIDFQIKGCGQCGYDWDTPNADTSLQCLRTNFRELMANGGFPTQQITCYNEYKPVSTQELLFSDE